MGVNTAAMPAKISSQRSCTPMLARRQGAALTLRHFKDGLMTTCMHHRHPKTVDWALRRRIGRGLAGQGELISLFTGAAKARWQWVIPCPQRHSTGMGLRVPTPMFGGWISLEFGAARPASAAIKAAMKAASEGRWRASWLHRGRCGLQRFSGRILPSIFDANGGIPQPTPSFKWCLVVTTSGAMSATGLDLIRPHRHAHRGPFRPGTIA